MRNILVRGAVFLVLMTMGFASAISDVRITNVRGDSFSISWISDIAEEGSVIVPGEGTFIDKRVQYYPSIIDKKFKLHYVDVNCDPNTTYSFQIKSGTTVSGNYSVKSASYTGTAGSGLNIAGKVNNTTYIEKVGYYQAENIQNVYYEMYIEKPNGTRSAVRSGLSGITTDATGFIHEWETVNAPFLNQANTNLFSKNDNEDVLVVSFMNFSRGYTGGYNNIGSKRVAELRIPLNVSRADVTMFENPIPVIDSFDGVDTLGWQKSGNLSLALTTNAQYQKALEVTAYNADQDGYNGYFLYDFSTTFYEPALYGGSNIKTNKAYDWGRYRYIKFSVKNVGDGPVDLKLDIKDNDNKDFSFNSSDDNEWVYNLKLMKNDGQWRDIYIPLSQVLLSKNNVGGDSVFNPLQMIDVFAGYNLIYPGSPMIGFAVSTGKAGRSGKIIIENIELVTTRNNPYSPAIESDTDMDGIPNADETANGLNPNLASDAKADPDGDGIDNYNEILNGTNPFVADGMSSFPEIDNFEKGITKWIADAGTTITTSVANTTDTKVSWNYQNSMLISGKATDYYVGGIQKDILSDVSDWTTDYKTLNMLIKANSNVGDRVAVKLIETDGDVWQFEQYIGDIQAWTYLGMLLDRFTIKPGSTGNGIKQFNQTAYIRVELLSATATGNVSVYVDNINVSTSNISGDTDGDGIPNWYEVSNNLNVLVANLGDTDGDGWSDLEEYSARTNPTQWTPHFPLIDNFERMGYTWVAEGISATRPTQAGYPTTSLLVNGLAVNYFGGFVGSYIYNPLNTMPAAYKSVAMLINNKEGKIGDKIEMQFQDKDGDAYSFTQILVTADWKWYTFVLSNFTKKNTVASGNGLLDLNNLTYVGYSFISATQNGVIKAKLDEISLSTVPTSDDTDGDGLPNWWEIQYGLSSNVANINPDQSLKDTDGDGLTDLQEFINGSDPTKKVFFPEIDNFELVAGVPVNGSWGKTTSVDIFYEKVTESSVSWNLLYSIYVETKEESPAVNYYGGTIYKNINIPAGYWTSDYKSLKYVAKNLGSIGDKVEFVITDADGDEFSFTQTFGDKSVWTYYTLLLDKFKIKLYNNNGVMDFDNGVTKLAINILSSTPTGDVYFRLDNISISTVPTSDDTDGDGLPNWYETMYGIDPNVVNTGDVDGDGWSDLSEYVARTNPNQWTPRFPLIDNFERAGYTWTAEGITATRSTQAGYPTTSLLVNGLAVNYFGGFVGSYIYNPLNTMPAAYKSVAMLINNKEGKVGDKIEMQFQDKDGDAYSFTQVLVTSDWKWYTFVLSNFTKKNSVASGNSALDLNNLTFVGYSFISATQNGTIKVKLDEISLSMVPTSDDTDGDGLPNWWETQYGLNPNVANINPDQSLKDTDGDNITDLDEYLRGLNPTIKNLFPEIDNFEDGLTLWVVDAGTTLVKTSASTDTTVSWNYQKSMLLSGTATGSYYISGVQKDVLSDVSGWTSDYLSLKMLLLSSGQVGDKVAVKIVETDGDVWAFNQYISDLNKWTYLTMMLDRFELVSGSTGNGIKEFNKTNFIRLEVISVKATGNVSMYIDSLSVAKTPTSDDTDGDGLPNWYETMYGINPNVVNTGDVDGDGWSDLSEYVARTNPNQWTPRFPLIDNFERVGYTWTAEGITATRSTQAGYPTTSLLINGLAVNYFGGSLGSYIYNPLNTMPAGMMSVAMYIDNSNGKVGDKIEMQLQDKDGDVFSFTQVLVTSNKKWYTLVLSNFKKKNTISSGNSVLDLNNLTFVGYSFISAFSTGNISVKLDEISLSAVPTSDDTDGDGLPDWWEIFYDLDSNVANINPSGDIADTDQDGMNDLEEYLTGTNPNQGYLRNVLKGWNFFSVVNEGGQKISQIVAYLETKLGAGTIKNAAIWNRDDGKFIYMSDDFTVAYGESYYIDSSVRKAISASVTASMPQSYFFKNGWNLLGKPAGKAYKASELLKELNDRNLDGEIDDLDLPLRAEEIRVYDNYYYTGWLRYRYDNTGTDFTVGATYKSYGFMIKVKEDLNWTPKKDM